MRARWMDAPPVGIRPPFPREAYAEYSEYAERITADYGGAGGPRTCCMNISDVVGWCVWKFRRLLAHVLRSSSACSAVQCCAAQQQRSA